MKNNAKDLFVRAYELSGKVREAYLQEACGDDAELRLEVQRLLVKAEKFDSFLRDEDGATLDVGNLDTTYTEAEGDQVGPYVLRQEIGEGGFGTVWMAEQREPISRMVALKVVKAGMDTKQVLSRFEAERQALAMMDHPNIAKVLDGGATTGGRPYFAMELVKGIPITQFCEQQKFGPRRRLELFKDVCSAINHAHQKGIIHRDLKPSNVMVTLHGEKPVAKVIDFGIAKATQGKLTEKTLFTRFEQFLGTPAYMSPEQASLSGLDVDTRADIYSLGVLLYELLAGAPPFDQKCLLSAGYDEMRRIISEEEPPKPSTRCTQTQAGMDTAAAGTSGSKPKRFHVSANALKGDLDWIVMKAIEKDRGRRYETANAFAADIGRYLQDEPVLAAAPSAVYKFKKFARRNKGAFGVAAAMVVLLLAGTAATGWQAVRATDQAERANAAEKLATERLVESEEAREEAEAISEFLTGMFESSRPGEEKGGRQVKVADVLDRAAKDLDKLADQPERRAALRATIGDTYQALGLYPEAIALQEKVHDYYSATAGPEHADTMDVLTTLAWSHHRAGHLDQALRMFREVVVLSRKVDGSEHRNTLGAMCNLARSCLASGQLEEGLSIQQEVLAAIERNGAKIPNCDSIHSIALENLAALYSAMGRGDEVLALKERVLAIRREANGLEHPDTLIAMNNVVISLADAGRHDEAIGMGEDALKLSNRVLGPEHPGALLALNNLGKSLFDAGRRDEALTIWEDLLPKQRKVNGSNHPDTLGTLQNLSTCYNQAGKFTMALEMAEEVLDLSREVLGPEHPHTLRRIHNLAEFYSGAGQGAKALELREEAFRLTGKKLGAEHPDTLGAMDSLMLSYREAGLLEKSIELGEKVVPLKTKIVGAEDRSTLGARTNLAGAYLLAGRLDESMTLQEETLAIKRRVLREKDPYLSAAVQNMATIYKRVGRRDEALELREEALEIRRKAFGPEHPATLSVMVSVPSSYHDAGRTAEALEMGEEVLELCRKVFGREHPITLGAMTELSIFYLADERPGEALKLREEVLELSRAVNGPEHRDTLGAMTNLAESLLQGGRLEEGIALQEKALAIKRRVLPPSDPYLKAALENLVEAYKQANEDDKSQPLREEIERLEAQRERPEKPADFERDAEEGSILAAKAKLAAALRASGDETGAEKLENEIAASEARAKASEEDN